MSSVIVYACDGCDKIVSEEEYRTGALVPVAIQAERGAGQQDASLAIVIRDRFELCAACSHRLIGPFKKLKTMNERDEALARRLAAKLGIAPKVPPATDETKKKGRGR